MALDNASCTAFDGQVLPVPSAARNASASRIWWSSEPVSVDLPMIVSLESLANLTQTVENGHWSDSSNAVLVESPRSVRQPGCSVRTSSKVRSDCSHADRSSLNDSAGSVPDCVLEEVLT